MGRLLKRLVLILQLAHLMLHLYGPPTLQPHKKRTSTQLRFARSLGSATGRGATHSSAHVLHLCGDDVHPDIKIKKKVPQTLQNISVNQVANGRYFRVSRQMLKKAKTSTRRVEGGRGNK